MTAWFPGLVEIGDLGADLVIDGEVACCDEAGTARFEWLGRWRAGRGDGTVRFYPFDLLRLDGVDLRDRPWAERTDRLHEVLAAGAPDGCQVMTSSEDGVAMWAATAAVGAEGVVAKRRDSGYRPGRSRWWLKTKHRTSAWFDVAAWRPTTPGRPGGLVVAKGDDVVGVAVLALPASERAGLAGLIDRYGRRHPTGTVTLPDGAVCAQVSFMPRPGVAVLREAVAHSYGRDRPTLCLATRRWSRRTADNGRRVRSPRNECKRRAPPGEYATPGARPWRVAVTAVLEATALGPTDGAWFRVSINFRTPAPLRVGEAWDLDNLVKPTLDAMASVFGALGAWKGAPVGVLF
jgi:hypothetical protein